MGNITDISGFNAPRREHPGVLGAVALALLGGIVAIAWKAIPFILAAL